MSEIKETSDYGMFKRTNLNREIQPLNLKRIKASLSMCNMLKYRPILVNKNFEIVDGQHRFEAAKELGLSIFYQVNEESFPEDIVLLNANQKRWGRDDYIRYYSNKGNENYEKLNRFCKKWEVSVDSILPLFITQSAASNSKLKHGTFKFPSDERIEQIEGLLQHSKDLCEIIMTLKGNVKFKTISKSPRFKEALFDLFSNESYDPERMKKNIELRAEQVRICTTKQAYYDMLKDIYNFRARNKIGEE